MALGDDAGEVAGQPAAGDVGQGAQAQVGGVGAGEELPQGGCGDVTLGLDAVDDRLRLGEDVLGHGQRVGVVRCGLGDGLQADLLQAGSQVVADGSCHGSPFLDGVWDTNDRRDVL